MKKNVFLLCAILFLHAFFQRVHADDLMKYPSFEKIGRQNFEKWVEKSQGILRLHSKIARTSRGPIEYVRQGKGPVVLCVHGAPGGYDQSLLIGDWLVKEGFSVLGVSRPGYLRTPLSVGKTVAEQADALIALLDHQHIEKVAIIGFSAGSPIALQVALRYPERVWGLVLESICGRPQEASVYTIVQQLLMLKTGTFSDFGLWLLYKATRFHPSSVARWILPLDNGLNWSILKRRIDYVLAHQRQIKFLQRLLYSIMPISPRRVGLINDIETFESWSTFPLTSLQTPTLVVQARLDDNGSYSQAENIARQIPQASLVTVESSGHFIWLGKYSDKWERQLKMFLKVHAPKRPIREKIPGSLILRKEGKNSKSRESDTR